MPLKLIAKPFPPGKNPGGINFVGARFIAP